MRILHNINVDFMSKRKMFYIISSIIILSGFVSFAVKGIHFGLDFKGGTEIIFRFPREVEIAELRNMLDNSKLGAFEIKSFGKATDFIVRTERKGVGHTIANEVEKVFESHFTGRIQTLQENVVEAKIGGEMRRDAVLAVFFSLLGILVYIGFRFKFIFGLGAVVALFHDTLLTLGLVSIFYGVIPGLNLEFDQTLIAAFLTLIGYSNSDTVIVFDRIRENLKLYKTMDFEAVINKSVNATMSRTILTSSLTMATMVALWLFGGEPTRGFAFTMVIGIITGTYSSIFVASSLTLDITRSRNLKITF